MTTQEKPKTGKLFVKFESSNEGLKFGLGFWAAGVLIVCPVIFVAMVFMELATR